MGWNWVTPSGNHVASVTWVQHGKSMWAYTMGPISDVSGQVNVDWNLVILCETHVVSVAWVQHEKPMWAYSMGPIRDIMGQSKRGMELGNTIWEPCCFSNMGPT